MRPDFADFVRLIYGDKYKDHDTTKDRPLSTGFMGPIFFLNHNMLETSEAGLSSKSNKFEAEFAVKLAKFAF